MRLTGLIIGALAWALFSFAYAAEGPFYIHGIEVNLRAEPNGEILLVFEPDDKVFVIERKGNWSYVSAPGRDEKGWVWSAYVGEERLGAAETDPDAAAEAAAASGGAVQVRDVNIEPGDTLAVTSYGDVCEDPAPPAAPPEETYRPPAQQPQPEAAQAVFYEPFEHGGSDVTIPAMLGLNYYPVGGNDIALISGSNVNVRAEASLDSKIVGKVNSGDKVYLVTESGDWQYVSIPAKDLRGYIYNKYVDELPRVEITGQNVRLRESPSLSARIKTEVNLGEVFHRFDKKNGWVLVASSASGLKGWIHADYIKKTTKEASRPYKVTADELNFRHSPTVDSDIIAAVLSGTKVEVLGRNDKWSYVEHGGKRGWMYSAYLDPAFAGAPKQVFGVSIGSRLIRRAKAMEGTPYVWGGESDGGVDCSGLIYKLLIDEGASARELPRRASTQMAQLGQAVDKEDLEPGDLVFFTTYKAGPSHVGIYLGDGDFIHASSAQGKVTISNMSDGYYKRRFVGARRITESELKGLK